MSLKSSKKFELRPIEVTKKAQHIVLGFLLLLTTQARNYGRNFYYTVKESTFVLLVIILCSSDKLFKKEHLNKNYFKNEFHSSKIKQPFLPRIKTRF